MKIINYRLGDAVRAGCIVDHQVIDLHQAYVARLRAEGHPRAEQLAAALVPYNTIELLEGGEKSLEEAQKAMEFALENGLVIDRASVKIEAPIVKPNKIICVGHNYREHILEMKRELPEYPVIFAKFSNAIIGPEDDVPLPPITNQLDYEAEFAFVIGKRARNVKQADALEYVAGYTIVNDVTARDLQRRTIQWLQGKTLDGSAPMGPWLVTKDEIPDPHSLEISLTVNGEERQRSNTRNLVFNVHYLVEFLSHIMTLEPGDVICTGTPGGVGVARHPQVFLQHGDVVRIEVERIGVLENRVVAVPSQVEVESSCR
ncbi:fumarylacetoacetate (FAA) hydrolase family protein [Anoxybacillus sp. B7M1]|jgi:acylpyruvate hydrolase|uniref:fumarylacetoacetate hydrolase family protein n=1 Tax=unclassified Anoxybacillus TaxID=2639704 RepID=UPI0005CCAB28|nr:MULTISPECIES: fumarylacetoacetate hydrolase family protein [unclassified Anoxybacillus]ANB57170.1 fumarylacetoacetate (FAA) hydrolase family protein [Anoxybacillus sp. B2M1]ANB63205.1 fumarylacetoacetate (FAA) hydrolase family protein [Anoxybacillus sp. B7M1]